MQFAPCTTPTNTQNKTTHVYQLMGDNSKIELSSDKHDPIRSHEHRRGRRSFVPTELREYTRRVKKQNMERRRRASISDKMTSLHELAMNLIGIDPHSQHKLDKTDVLNTCYKVFEGIATIVHTQPELQVRLRQLYNGSAHGSEHSPAILETENIPLKLTSTNSSETKHRTMCCYRENKENHPNLQYQHKLTKPRGLDSNQRLPLSSMVNQTRQYHSSSSSPHNKLIRINNPAQHSKVTTLWRPYL